MKNKIKKEYVWLSLGIVLNIMFPFWLTWLINPTNPYVALAVGMINGFGFRNAINSFTSDKRRNDLMNDIEKTLLILELAAEREINEKTNSHA
jgi:hypothetical protein